MSAIPSLILLLVLIGTNAFFAASEIAVISANANRMKKMADEGNKRAKLLLQITDEPSDFLSTIQVGVTLSGFLASAVAADNFAVYFDEWLAFLPINKSLLHGIVLVVLNIILSYFTLVLGEITPKRIAMKYPDKLALGVVGVIWGLYKVAKPFIKLVTISTNGILRLLHIKPEDDEEKVTEEEILMMVEAGEETGSIDHNEKDMIENIFEFDDARVSEHIIDIRIVCAVPADMPLSQLLEVAAEEKYSRIPVYDENIDNILGVVHVKDLIQLAADPNRRDTKASELMRPILYVPETIQCSKLLKQFQEQKIHMAVVVDEYGGTEGIVTMEDLLESIVGNIDDEYDDQKDAMPEKKTSQQQKVLHMML